MSDQNPQQPPYTNVPYTNVPDPGSVPPPTGGYPPPAPASSGLSENTAAGLAYITIIPAIIFLVLEPYNRMPFVKFHSIQCLGLAVASIVLQIAATILHLVLHAIPGMGLIFVLINMAISIGICVLWLIAIINAFQGKWFKIPVIGDFAEKQARS